jgi:hypothetical protein
LAATHVADLSHSRMASWSTVLQDHDTGFVDIKVWVEDAFTVVFNCVKDNRAPPTADGFKTAPSGARLPRNTATPSCSTRGLCIYSIPPDFAGLTIHDEPSHRNFNGSFTRSQPFS